ncbi:ester cyclase [Rhodococcoides yunnanense]|uniref:Ester cyclase n=1 Tax=Rhodococcoides yunnanense TaxID=278209 RepID=A0ABU4BKP9_9NOCA|nr:ester cyclase [Rhodococcus yunnanensis]MDV6264801.1 ester cyclase [Rhodococcus yunnanensis]
MKRVSLGLLLVFAAACSPTASVDDPVVDPSGELIKPGAVHLGDAPVTDRTRHVVSVAQNLYTFWDTGEQVYLDRAVDDSFVDNTLPTGRPQGPNGPVVASAGFRTAIPDLSCELADLYITGDTFTARLIFRGHFTGAYGPTAGSGQPVEFDAIDIQHVGEERIVEDWHLEDNLTFMQQAGLVGTG